jgi:hypothetical protein
MRSFVGCFLASMCIVVCTLSENRLTASDSGPLDKSGRETLAALTKLRQEKLKAAEERYAAINVAFQAGTREIFDVYAASRDWKEAAYDSAKTKRDRKTALEKHHDRMAELYKHTHALAGANALGGESDKDSSARFWELEAKIWLLEEETKP